MATALQRLRQNHRRRQEVGLLYGNSFIWIRHILDLAILRYRVLTPYKSRSRRQIA